MFRINGSEHRARRHHHRRTIFDFMKKPQFQIGLVIFVGLLIIFLSLNGQKSAEKVQVAPNATAGPPTTPARTQPPGTPAPNVISVIAAYDLYMNGSAYLLDVRERQEWDQSHIPGSTLLPLGQVASLVNDFPRDRTIIIISGSDNRSQQARDILKDAGFVNVTSMAGGIVYWKNQGYPTEP